MSLQAFVNGIGDDVLRAMVKGAPIVAIWICVEGEKVLLKAAATERCTNLEITPAYKIHGIPLRVHEGLPTGHVWYVHKGAKRSE